MKRYCKTIILFISISVLTTFGFAQTGIRIEADVLLKGDPVNITLEEAVDSIIVRYRPNSQVVKIEYLTSNLPSKNYSWTPAEAGVVALKAGNSSKNVSVRFKGISWSGIIIMIVAGVLLFGGAVYAFRLLMYGKTPASIDAKDLDHRVDT